MPGKPDPAAVDEYIARFPPGTRALLEELRELIRAAAPEAAERISYGMPAFELQGILVWYAGFGHHIGFYPKGSAIAAFRDELKVYKTAKGTVQFPLDRPLPGGLIRRMVEFRAGENRTAAAARRA